MSHAQKIHWIAVFNHLIAIAGLVYVILYQQWQWLAVSGTAAIFVTIVCVNIGLHRYISHASFKTGPLRAKFLTYATVIAAFGSPLSWTAMHRYHHAKSGSALDNQSPKNIGYVRAWLTLYDPITVPPAMVKDIIRNHDCMFVHRHYFTLLAAYVLILFVIDPLLPVFAFCIPAAICYQAAGAFAVIPHDARFGYKVLPSREHDDSVNSPFASLLSLGEGWHNYHHTRPSDHRHGHKWWEIDPPAWIIERFFKI
jgi:stearoyl-CoA desaturase (delta-9 desaturase)